MKSTPTFDYIIIGGGIAGLYTARCLEHKYHGNKSILILEKNAWLGGRTRVERFHSKSVVTGAGVGRLKKDVLLHQLVSEFDPSPHTWKSSICYRIPHRVSTIKYVREMKRMYRRDMLSQRTTFRDFFLRHYSRDEYTAFCQSNGYTDFENADVVDTVYDYGFEDNLPGVEYFRVEWNRLVKHIRHQLQTTRIYTRQTVKDIHRQPDDSYLISTQSRQYHATNIIFAGHLEGYPVPIVKQQIGCQSFLRMYGYSKTGFLPDSGTQYVENSYQKIIPISRHVRMISYSDNHHADVTFRMTKEHIQKTFPMVDDIRTYYWKCGTHFYHPLQAPFKSRRDFIAFAQHPQPHLFLVGELISRNQGWTEGALESVHAILPQL